MKTKKIVTLVAVIVLFIGGIALAVTSEDTTKYTPEIEFYKDIVADDGFDIHISMCANLPDYGECKYIIKSNLDENAAYGNSGIVEFYYQGSDEIVDSMEGEIVVDLAGCTVDEALDRLYDYATNYNFKEDAKYGTTFEKVIIW